MVWNSLKTIECVKDILQIHEEAKTYQEEIRKWNEEEAENMHEVEYATKKYISKLKFDMKIKSAITSQDMRNIWEFYYNFPW